jgi:solute carrier family 35, member F1/2
MKRLENTEWCSISAILREDGASPQSYVEMALASVYGSMMDDQRELISEEHMQGAGATLGKFRKFYSLAFGQVLSILVAGTGACTTLFQKYSHMNAPSAQNAPNYILLSLFLAAPLRRVCFEKNNSYLRRSVVDQHDNHEEGEESEPERSSEKTPKTSDDHWWKYAILSLVDVEANVTVVWAYQYTSITSAMLLDCFTIPSVMILSYLFLNARYTMRHILGALLCLCGICLIIVSDVLEGSDGSSQQDAWLGDMLCIVSSFLYSVSNVIQEKWVRSAGPPRFLGRLGIFGAIVSMSQSVILERKALFVDTDWNARGIGAWAGYTVTLNLAYILTSWFLVDADAAFFNLSLLTSDVYAVLFSYFVSGTSVPPLYFLAFAFTISGLFVYHRTPPATQRPLSSEPTSTTAIITTGIDNNSGAPRYLGVDTQGFTGNHSLTEKDIEGMTTLGSDAGAESPMAVYHQ